MKQLEHLILLTPTLSVTAPALLSAIAPCIALPPPSVESYLLHPCSRPSGEGVSC
jgi:hypothetical protein